MPFFWSVHFKKSLRYAGHGQGWEDVIYQVLLLLLIPLLLLPITSLSSPSSSSSYSIAPAPPTLSSTHPLLHPPSPPPTSPPLTPSSTHLSSSTPPHSLSRRRRASLQPSIAAGTRWWRWPPSAGPRHSRGTEGEEKIILKKYKSKTIKEIGQKYGEYLRIPKWSNFVPTNPDWSQLVQTR